MNFIGCLRSHVILVLLQCFNISGASASGFASCTTSSFSRSIGYILRGFLLSEVEVGDIMECKKRCIISANCLSLNILTNTDGRFVCQLNSGRKENGVRELFVRHGAGDYYGLKVYKSCIIIYFKKYDFLQDSSISHDQKSPARFFFFLSNLHR